MRRFWFLACLNILLLQDNNKTWAELFDTRWPSPVEGDSQVSKNCQIVWKQQLAFTLFSGTSWSDHQRKKDTTAPSFLRLHFEKNIHQILFTMSLQLIECKRKFWGEWTRRLPGPISFQGLLKTSCLHTNPQAMSRQRSRKDSLWKLVLMTLCTVQTGKI